MPVYGREGRDVDAIINPAQLATGWVGWMVGIIFEVYRSTKMHIWRELSVVVFSS